MSEPRYPYRKPLREAERPVDLTKPADAPENAPQPPSVPDEG